MSRIVISSHTGRGTGFGRIAAGIANSLAMEYEVHLVGLGPNQATETWLGHTHHRLDPTRTSALIKLIAQYVPEVVIVIGQGQLLSWQVTKLRRERFLGIILSYVPVEGLVYNPASLSGLWLSTAIVSYTASGAAALKAALKVHNPTLAASPIIATISHALDRPQFSFKRDREQLRAELFPEFTHRSKGTWLINANRNDLRKNPELTLQAFASIAKKNPEATLIFHCKPRRSNFDLRIKRDCLGLRNQVIISMEENSELWSEENLAKLYASCEIGINSASGEGWGLVAFEHALYGGAQIIPDHEGLREIWGDAPVWIPASRNVFIDAVFSGQIPDREMLSTAMHQMINHSKRTSHVADACSTRASDPLLCWDYIGSKWRSLVKQVHYK